MSDVSVVGLGEMGSALARALVGAGKGVTVWNRNMSKAPPLIALGATAADTVAEALEASPVTVICLSDYAATLSLLDEPVAREALEGKLVIQLSSGTPDHARSFDGWIRDHGARYVDGAIAAWPRQIGGPEAAITVAGSEKAFAAAEPLLRTLAGNINYAGTNIGHPATLANAGLAYFAGHWLGFAHGAAVCEAEGIDPAVFGDMMAEIAPMFADDMLRMGKAMAENRFDSAEATIKTISADLRWLAEYAERTGISNAFPRLAADIFQQAKDAGAGAQQHGAVIKVIRPISNSHRDA